MMNTDCLFSVAMNNNSCEIRQAIASGRVILRFGTNDIFFKNDRSSPPPVLSRIRENEPIIQSMFQSLPAESHECVLVKDH